MMSNIHSKFRSIILLSMSCLISMIQLVDAKDTITVYSYYSSPPFSMGANKGGLIQEVVETIDQNAKNLSLDLRIISRPALTEILKTEKNPFIVAFAHPTWFQDKERIKYLWSRPLFSDHNVLISNELKPIDFKGQYSFAFQKVGVPRGYQIYLLDDLVKKGKANRQDVASIPALIKMVAQSKIKMAVIPYPIVRYYVDQLKLNDTIHFSNRPHQTYERHFMLVNGSVELNGDIDDAIRKARNNASLKKILKKYGY